MEQRLWRQTRLGREKCALPDYSLGPGFRASRAPWRTCRIRTGITSNRKQDSVAAGSPTVNELPNFLLEGVVFGSERTPLGECFESFDRRLKSIEPLDRRSRVGFG